MPYECVVPGNLEQALSRYKEIKKSNPKNWMIQEDRLNTIGYNEKSLKLNPKSQRSKYALKQLKTNKMKIIKNIMANLPVLILIILIACGCSKEDSSIIPNDDTPLDGRGGGVIAYSVTYTSNTNTIFLMNADGSNDGHYEIYVMNSDGSDQKRLT